MILVKFLAQSGYCSRRKAEELIKYHHVQVNGNTVSDPTFEVKETEKVLCDGKIIKISNPISLLFHKPAGCITSKSDPEGRQTVIDWLPVPLAQVVDPVGRLDFHTSGVLLLTSDGALAYSLSHPKHKVSKTYEVTVSRPLDEELIATIRKGVQLEDGFIRPDKVVWSVKTPQRMLLTIHSGKNRVIKRIMERLNIFVKKLHRREFAGIELESLKPGAFRDLTKKEIAILSSLGQKSKPKNATA